MRLESATWPAALCIPLALNICSSSAYLIELHIDDCSDDGGDAAGCDELSSRLGSGDVDHLLVPDLGAALQRGASALRLGSGGSSRGGLLGSRSGGLVGEQTSA